jgi:hypothetical protein
MTRTTEEIEAAADSLVRTSNYGRWLRLEAASEQVKRRWLDRAKAALEAADAVRKDAEPKWREISTAPKDGTRILITGGTYWRDYSPPRHDEKPMGIVTTGFLSDGVYIISDILVAQPTHWMPLPQPPEGEKSTIKPIKINRF